MNDQIETATEELPVNGIVLGRTGATIVISLAAYGAVSLLEDAVSFVKKINRNRKAEEAAKVETDTPEK